MSGRLILPFTRQKLSLNKNLAGNLKESTYKLYVSPFYRIFCPEIVTLQCNGAMFSLVLPFLIQNRTVKVCFFSFISLCFMSSPTQREKRSNVGHRSRHRILCPLFLNAYIVERKKAAKTAILAAFCT